MPVELTDAAGNTLLMLAAYHGHADAVRVLVDMAPGWTPSTIAARPRWPGRCSRATPTSSASWWRPAQTLIWAPSARAAAEFFARPDLAALLPPAP